MTQLATPKSTAQFAQQHPELTYQLLGDTGLLVSQVGFGTYRVHIKSEAHQQALRGALNAGINLIDTSSNYGDGGSEELIGKVISDMLVAGEIQRENVVVVSKVGYLQGQNYELSQQRKKAGNRFPDLVQYSAGLEHCIHPEFIADQLTRSLDRLGIAKLDVYLLHNPEYFLQGAKRSDLPVADARKIYYERIEKAFRHLETEVEAGRIGWYGVSSNTFPSANDDYSHTSLTKMWEIAETISPDHHFRVVQLPMNLFENGGAIEPNQPNGQTFLQFAHDKNFAVLVNRPLNAIMGNGLLRLAGVPLPDNPVDPAIIPPRIADLAEAEDELHHNLLKNVKMPAETAKKVHQMLIVGNLLSNQWQGFGSYTQWLEIVSQQLVPRVNYGLHLLATEAFGDNPIPDSINKWMGEYAEMSNQAFAALGAHYQAQSAQRASLLKAHVRVADDDWKDAGTLSQLAIRALRTTQGITCVLVGMRDEAYVEDVLKELVRSIETKNRDEAWQRLGIQA